MKSPVTVDTRFFLAHFPAEVGKMREKMQRKIVEPKREKAIVPMIVIHEVYKFQYDPRR